MSDRVRFAPAPSGWLHVGSVRAALYNWLHVRRNGGQFIFRIEDTDAARATRESMDSMHEAFAWLGLDVDEGVIAGGPYGPYLQSERAAFHQAVARRLEEAGHTWRDHRTAAELDAFRAEAREKKIAPVVHGEPGSVVGDTSNPSTLRLALPRDGACTITDMTRGEVSWDWKTQSDPVIQRSNGAVTYPLANSADDVSQGVTLVCRGEDLLSVTPRQIVLYDVMTRDGLIDEALEECGLPARDPSWDVPQRFSHLSMIVGPDRKKLSKRHGAVAIQQFAAKGVLPEVLVNYLALLGWAPDDGRERLTVQEMIESFDLEGAGKTAAMFDEEKLLAFNGERIRQLSNERLTDLLIQQLDGSLATTDLAAAAAVDTDTDGGTDAADDAPAERPVLVDTPPTDDQRRIVAGLAPLVSERMQRLDEILTYAPPFLRDTIEFDEKSVDKVLRKDGAIDHLQAAREVLAGLDKWITSDIDAGLRAVAEEQGVGLGKIAQPVRVAVTGSSVSPPLFESLELLGREVSLTRMDDCIATFTS